MANEKSQSIAVDDDGLVDLEALDRLLSAASGRSLVSIMLANNETGVILPISEVVMQLDSSLRGQKTVLRDGEK